MTAEQLLSAVADTGYFSSPETGQELFRQLVEGRLNLSLERAIALLTESDLAIFSYASESGIHPRDALDSWQLRLTSTGELALSGKL